MKFNFRKISAVATSVLLTGMTMGVAAAANYPAPFVDGGSANVAIVYGTGAGVSALDQTQALNINLDLQASMGSDTGTTGTVTGGDSVLIAKSSDNLNIRDSWTDVFTGNVDEDDLPVLLADGTYIANDNDEFDYEQKISLGAPDLSHFRDSDYEDLVGLEEKTPVVGFKISSNTWIMNYTLDFSSDAVSSITSGDYDDFEGSDLPLLGKTYYVSNFDQNTSNDGYLGKLELLDSAEIGTVSEGETVTVAGHNVAINFIDNDEVTFVVDGVNVPSSGKLQAGDSYKLDDGAYIGIRDVSKLEVSGETGSSTFSIGSGKLEITSASDVKLNDDTITGVKGYVHAGTPSNDEQKIDKIVIEWTTDDEEFLTPDADLVLPGFGALKFSMGELIRAEEEKIIVDRDGDNSLELTVPIKDGTVSFNLLYNDADTGNFSGLGKASDERLATAAPTENLTFYEKDSGNDYDEWFVVSYNLTTEAESYVARAKVSYDSTDARNETTLQKLTPDGWVDVCVDKVATDSCDFGQASVTITAINYTSGGNETVTLEAGTNTNFNTVFTEGGLKIYLPYLFINNSKADMDRGAINLTDTGAENHTGFNLDKFYLFFASEDKDENLEQTHYNLTLDDTSNLNLEVSEIINSGTGGPYGLEVGDSTSIYEAYLNGSDTAPRVLHYTKPDEDWVEIYYPKGDSETYAEVFLTTEGATVVSGSAASGGTASLGNVIVKDSEVSSVSTKNLIIVGGSCINSAAATVLGGAYCGADFTAATGVGAGQFLIKGVSGAYSAGKIALVVAGYEAADTVAATSYLTTQTVDTSKAYKGTSSTSAELIVE